jgi:hypothetical protein
MALVAQSVGAVIVTAWVHDYAPRIRALVLAAPAFKVKLYVPFLRCALAIQYRMRGNFFVNSYVKPQFLTHDPERIASYRDDPLITRPIAANVLLGLYETADRVVSDARAITIPTQVLISGADWVVHHAPQHRFFVNLGSSIKERHVLPGFYHDTFGELGRAVAIDLARRFLRQRFDEALVLPHFQDSDKRGYTRDEADILATPLPLMSFRGLYWAGVRASLRIASLLSNGIRLGRRTGFDSGSTLDYVYRNIPTGKGAIGRMIDRSYLDAIGWRGIRQRKGNVEELLKVALRRLREAGRPVHLVDIAAGHGRYVLEAFASDAELPDSIELRDYSELNVKEGTKLIAEKQLEKIAKFRKGNAFDASDLAAITPRPTLAVVSGLYELFSDNDLIRKSLAGLKEAIEPGGYLVYTCQPWHPQLEFIARALTSHREGRPWIMRRRTQAEMDELVSSAGFHKVTQRIDDWAIFTVSLAIRTDRETPIIPDSETSNTIANNSWQGELTSAHAR